MFRMYKFCCIYIISIIVSIFIPITSSLHHHRLPSAFRSNFIRRDKSNLLLSSSSSSLTADSMESYKDLKLVTYNILAPCYNRVTSTPFKKYESDLEDAYMTRNEKICNKIMEINADIICVQEFWSQCKVLKDLYDQKLSSKYMMKELRRTSHWRTRDDGLAVFINKERLVLLDSKDILFHDCGDRVAQLLLLGIKPPPGHNGPYKSFICINTHLLFPHNEYSTKIRVREMSKILDFVEAYRQADLCKNICGRSDVRIPVVIAGDFNGSPKGAVFQLMQSQNFHSAQEEYWCSSNNSSTNKLCSDQIDISSIEMKHHDIKSKWVSHKSHRNQIIPVDHVFYCNPSDQIESKLPALPDWTNLVFRELKQRIIDEVGSSSMRDAFSIFDQDNTNYVTRSAFESALSRLGFDGEGAAALTKDEIEVLIESADRNGDGLIDYKEFCDRFWIASENIESSGLKGMKNAYKRSRWLLKSLDKEKDKENDSSTNTTTTASNNNDNNNVTEKTEINITKDEVNSMMEKIDDSIIGEPLGDLKVKSVSLYPKELEEGIWPSNYDLSDHGIVEVVFTSDDFVFS